VRRDAAGEKRAPLDQRLERRPVVRLHEPAVPDNVGGEHGDEAALGSRILHATEV
jgi:hypothetical protein